MLCYGQDEMACHLHPILCTWDAVITCTINQGVMSLPRNVLSTSLFSQGKNVNLAKLPKYVNLFFLFFLFHETLYKMQST